MPRVGRCGAGILVADQRTTHEPPACGPLQRAALRCNRCNRLQRAAVCCNMSRCVATRCAALQQVRLHHGRLHCVATGCCVVVRSAVATRDAPLQRSGTSVGCVVERPMLSAVASRDAPLHRMGNRVGCVVARTCRALLQQAMLLCDPHRPLGGLSCHGCTTADSASTRSAAACASYRASSSMACACTRTHSGMQALPRRFWLSRFPVSAAYA